MGAAGVEVGDCGLDSAGAVGATGDGWGATGDGVGA